MNSKELIKDFERTINLAKARAYSSISLERPLTDSELKEFKEVMGELKSV